jgi:hypothetical protein
MEKSGGQPLYTSEIAPLEHEMYFALEQPILDEIMQERRQINPNEPFAVEYVRVSRFDGAWERVGVVVADQATAKQEATTNAYKVTVFHYKDDAPAAHAMNEKDSTVYYLTQNNKGLRCRTDVMYADGAYIDQHEMNGVEHTMLVDELLGAYQWQFAERHNRGILSE